MGSSGNPEARTVITQGSGTTGGSGGKLRRLNWLAFTLYTPSIDWVESRPPAKLGLSGIDYPCAVISKVNRDPIYYAIDGGFRVACSFAFHHLWLWPVSIHFSCGLRKREGYRSQQTLPAGKPKQSFQCANFFGFVCGLVYALDRLFAFITELV